MEISQKIAAARKKKGLTQEQLAGLTNITVRTIQRIETGKTSPRSYTLKAIAAALEISFEELNATEGDNNNGANDSIDLLSKEENGKHLLQIVCGSCFSYLVIPFVHFLIPSYILKKSQEQNPKIIAFARRVIRVQLYWQSALGLLLLASLAYNLIRAQYFQKSLLLNYLWPFFVMYIVNAIIITISLQRIKKADFSFRSSV
jgi:transcriptional regulator with XRE-family HTH domain